ncbi:hypothetical protein [Asaia krungthepensis]|uniref:Uncharacterized protein n=1 Tax=Asaia krungthepensis NRIC 0535 TaxID=1307925 RepID=A0ABQ0Q399_9PROT|nr:hypothetical protein [Asaia krungthepensis]GBQ89292.1 hypothetical protein AA0535_1757 [Asaia krungthepensis NRIC 0535]
MSGALFHVVEIETERPLDVVFSRGWGTKPAGCMTLLPFRRSEIDTLRLSDLGYASEAGHVFPPLLSEAFAIDRRIDLSPASPSSPESWGAITIANPGGRFDALIRDRVVDRMPIRIRAGRKRHDLARQIDIDPPDAALKPMFSGLGSPWQPDRLSVQIALREVSGWLDATLMPVGSYAGSGRFGGDSNVRGRSLPRLRGSALNLTPVLIDAVNLVYQISDGPGHVSALYEGGFAGGIVAGGAVADLYADPPAPGSWKLQSSSAGLFIRLGTKPVYAITVDASGDFPSGAAPRTPLTLLRQMLIEDLTMPAEWLSGAWDDDREAGWYWDGSDAVTGRQIVNTWLAGLGVRLVPSHEGTLAPVLLQMPDAIPDRVLTADHVIELSGLALDDGLSPPPYRWRVGYARNHTLQQGGSALHPRITAERQSFAQQQDRVATWYLPSIKLRYRQPGDLPVIPTALLNERDAQNTANAHGTLWGPERHLWSVTLPRSIAAGIDLGHALRLDLPAPGLRGGATGIVIGEQIRSTEASVTLTVLV